MRVYNDRSGNGNGIGLVRQVLVEGVINAAGPTPHAIILGPANIQLRGDFAARIILERSLNKGSSWEPVTILGLPTEFTRPCSESFVEPEPGARYRFNCVAYTSGPVYYRISR